jgi:phospholipid/cholesterol/gamma-HCH transport system substrate-binding protein
MAPPLNTPRQQPGHRPPWSRLRIGLIALVLVSIAVYFAFTKHVPFTHGYRIHAVFQSSNNLRPGSPVRIAGVNVGKVTDVARYRHTNYADVTMEIDDTGLPIHQDATLKIRPRIFLEGNFFVDLKPGSPSAPTVREDGTIGVTQTATPVQLDELFTALQADTRADLQHVLDEYGKALNAKPTAAQNATQDPDVQGLTGGAAFNKAYTYAPQALKGTAIVNTGLLGAEPHGLSRTIAAIARLSTELRGHEPGLQNLITNFNTTAGAFAAQSSALQQAVALLGPTVTNARDAFVALDKSFPPTRVFAREILPGVRETPATLDAAFPWIAQTTALLAPSELQGLLAQLQPATVDLAQLTTATVRFLPKLDQADRCFTNTIIPAGNIGVKDGALTTRRSDGSIYPNYKEFWSTMAGLAGEGSNFDGNGNYIRGLLGGGEHLTRFGTSKLRPDLGSVVGNATSKVLGTSPRYPTTPPPDDQFTAPCYRQPLPNVNGPQAGPGPAPTSTVVPTPPPLTQTTAAAPTGATP